MFISVKTLEVLGKKSSSAGRIWVIADTMLADGNGIAICCKIKRDDRTGHLPVMMMSAHAILRDVRKKCQADAYLSRPFDIDSLWEKFLTWMLKSKNVGLSSYENTCILRGPKQC